MNLGTRLSPGDGVAGEEGEVGADPFSHPDAAISTTADNGNSSQRRVKDMILLEVTLVAIAAKGKRPANSLEAVVAIVRILIDRVLQGGGKECGFAQTEVAGWANAERISIVLSRQRS
jgi:hypothetical protein